MPRERKWEKERETAKASECKQRTIVGGGKKIKQKIQVKKMEEEAEGQSGYYKLLLRRVGLQA